MAKEIDVNTARIDFSYNKETGVLICIRQRHGCMPEAVGKEAGYAHKGNAGKMYMRIRYNGSLVYVHRIIWVLVTGEQPDMIDHIDGNGLNNKWENLRSVPFKTNGKNQKKHTTNTSGITGVCYRKDQKSWRARITVDNKVINLGTFKNKSDAINARKEAEQKHGFYCES